MRKKESDESNKAKKTEKRGNEKKKKDSNVCELLFETIIEVSPKLLT